MSSWKRSEIEEYRLQNRGGKGLIDIKAKERNGPVVGVNFLRGESQVMLITEKGMIIRLNTADISVIGRNTQGVRLIQLEEGDHLVSVARLAERGFVVFASLAGFLGHVSLTGIDRSIVGVTAAASASGALLGSWLMTEKLKGAQVKRLLAAVLVAVAIKIAWGLLA